MDKVEAKVGFSIKKTFKEDNFYLDHDSQIRAIEKTFEDAKKPIEKHYSKPGVTAVEVLPILPDFNVNKQSIIWHSKISTDLFDHFSFGNILVLKLSSMQTLLQLGDLFQFSWKKCLKLWLGMAVRQLSFANANKSYKQKENKNWLRFGRIKVKIKFSSSKLWNLRECGKNIR